MSNPDWIRVNKHNPCPICGKPSWCLISKDGTKAICPRIQSDHPAGKGGWLHDVVKGAAPVAPVKTVDCRQALKAAPDVIDRTYRELLAALPLSRPHRENLIKRGLDDVQIRRLGYRSLPVDGRRNLFRYLASRRVIMLGVPGFWQDERGYQHLAGPAGILIPVRDLAGKIAGIQIRCDDTSDGKYKWLSSSHCNLGCSAAAAVHVARPCRTENNEVWITEGPLKADISAVKLQRLFLAIPGVSSWELVIPVLRRLLTRSVVIALDMDKLSNEFVDMYRRQLINRLIEKRYRVYEANWEKEYKGLDDLLKIGEIK